MAKYPYLNNAKFLKEFDIENFKEQYIRITVLDFQTEQPLANIEGKSTGGTCNLNAASSMRRTASCSLIVDPQKIQINGYTAPQPYSNITDVQNLISMNKKVNIETGFINTLKHKYPSYAHYDIIWFPLGVYVIKAANISKNNSGITISLTLNDKCALLNGDMGGVIPAATIFSEQESFNAAGTTREVDKILIKDIIKYLVVEFGGERPDNVIITDIEDYIVKVMKWTGKTDVYLCETAGKIELTLKKPDSSYRKFTHGMDVGYMLEPFVYPGTLECSAGETVAAILDKIKNTLGNFEWFYDLEGHFVFQEIKNYLLHPPTTTDYTKLSDKDYLSVANNSKSVYEFNHENKNLISSISSTPQYQNIKNDYLVWGITKTATGADKPIRYHLAFDNKPEINENGYFCIVYTDYKGLQQVIVLKEGENFKYYDGSAMNSQKMYYLVADNDVTGKAIWSVYHWDNETEKYRKYTDNTVCILKSDDWRTELYFQGLAASDKTFFKNYYSAELNAEWPKIYNVKAKQIGNTTVNNRKVPIYSGAYRTDVDRSNYEYWLDFVEGSDGGIQSISQFNVSNIGRRTKIETDNNSNCIFPIEIPDYIYLEAKGVAAPEYVFENRKGKTIIQVTPEVFNSLVIGGTRNPAYDKIKELLYQFTQYNESINLSVIPIYHLEPNTRITVYDSDTGINGDYLIKSISLPLAPNGTSSISATKCIERTF